MIEKLRHPLSRLFVPVCLILVWQAAAGILDNPALLPEPAAVGRILAHPGQKILITGSLMENTVISLARVMLGFLLASLVSVPLGILMGSIPLVERMMDTLVEMFRPIPPLAWVPLILAWFGITGVADLFLSLAVHPVPAGIQFSTVVIIFIGAFFPILINTVQGVKHIPAEYLESARTLGAGNTALLLKVIVPAVLPMVVTGLRIGLGIGWMCLVAAEMMPGSNCGLGYLIWYAYELLRADIIVAGMVVIGVIGFFMDTGFRLAEQKLSRNNQM